LTTDHVVRLLTKYIGMMTTVFSKIGVPGITRSLDVLCEALGKVEYGIEKLGESVDWLKKHIVEDFQRLPRHTQLHLLITAIFELKSVKDSDGDAVLPLWHQVTKNILDALDSCDNVPALRDRLLHRQKATSTGRRNIWGTLALE
jgi:hypothetical protein